MTLQDFERLGSVYEPLSGAMTIAAGLVLLVGAWRPAPWLLVLLVVAVLSAVWAVAVDRWLRLESTGEELPGLS